jgi:hypothetical protein
MGILIPNPTPLDNCPNLPIWAKHKGETYLVFIDETYARFFELNVYGYFCHAAVGIPEVEYDAVTGEMQRIFEMYKEILAANQSEFKHTEFKRIPFKERWELARRIRDVLRGHGGFVSTFYTPANSYLLERLRTDLLDEAEAVPGEHKALLERKSEEIRAAWTGPGQSDIIKQLLHTPVSALLHFGKALDLTFRIIYDPRHPKEDKVVWKTLQELDSAIEILTPGTAGRIREVNITTKSEDSIGLQLADLAAGEARAFLEANRDLLETGSSPKLITPSSDEPIQGIIQFKGQNFKATAITMMPNALQKRFFQQDPKERSVFASFRDVLLAGMMTCYGSWGTPRHIAVYDKMLIDQLD